MLRSLRKLTRGLGLAARTSRALQPHARGQGGLLISGMLLSILLLALHLAQPWPLKWIIDGLTHPASPWAGRLALLSAGFIAIALALALAEYGQRIVLAMAGSRIVASFRERMFRRLLALPLRFHERRSPGELLTRVIADVSRLRRGVINILLRICQNALVFVATVAVLLWLDIPLALIVLACGAAAALAMLAGNRRILSASRRARRKEGRLAAVVEENLRGVRDLQALGAGLDRRFEERSARSLRGELKVQRLEAAMLFRVETILAIAVCLILWRGSAEVASGRLTSGDLVLFVTYTLALYRPFAQFARQASQSGRTAACAERLIDIVERPDGLPDGPRRPESIRGELAFDGVGVVAPAKTRGGRERVLEGISLKIAPGERVAVMGANGAGKSTLLRLAARLQDPSAGTLRIDGVDARELALDVLRRRISMVCQEAVLFGLTVRENLALGCGPVTEPEMLQALEAAGSRGLVRRLANGLDAPVRARLLSPGERQRLAVARAMVRRGSLWLLDEPTAGVDKPAELEQALLEATRECTTLWTTHDPALAARLDRLVVLAEGRIVFDGPPADYRPRPKEELSCRP